MTADLTAFPKRAPGSRPSDGRAGTIDTHLWIEPEIHEQVKVIAKMEDRSVTATYRILVRAGLADHARRIERAQELEES